MADFFIKDMSREKIGNPILPTIETATTPETAIEIISERTCKNGLQALQKIFLRTFPDPHQISVVPILRSGERLGRELTEPLHIEINPMRMSYYKDDTSRLDKPICLLKPDINKIVTHDGITLPVVFAECVVDSQGTLIESMVVIDTMINKLAQETERTLDYPEYYTFAYATKTGDNKINIPNLVAAFKVNPDIWVGGLGCDLPGDKARELHYLVGILSPFAKQIPRRPYYKKII